MSGLYQMLMGKNVFYQELLALVGLNDEEKYPLGRFRDCYTNDQGSKVFVLTRNYGAEGSFYDEKLFAHPNFVEKTADSFDETYTVYEFNVVGIMQLGICYEIAKISDNTPAMARYEKLMKDIGEGKDTPGTRRALQVGEKLVGNLQGVMDGKQCGTVVEHDGASVEIRSTEGGLMDKE